MFPYYLFMLKTVHLNADWTAGHVCTLEAFQDTYWKPFIVTEEERQEACTLTFEHEQPAGSGGDSLSGF